MLDKFENNQALKFTVELDFSDKKANQSLNDWLKNFNKRVTEAAKTNHSELNSMLIKASQPFDALASSTKNLYSKIAEGEMQIQKIKNEQNLLNKELRQGAITEDEYISKTAQLNKLREGTVVVLRNHTLQLQQYNKALSERPAFTPQDTQNELKNAFRPGTGAKTLTSSEAFNNSIKANIDALNSELSELQSKLSNGSISNDQYAKSVDSVNSKLKSLRDNQEYFNNNTGKNLSLGDNIQKTAQEQIGLLEKAKIKLSELKAEASKANDFGSLIKINKEIEAYNQEIKRLSGIGTQAFEMQNKAMNNQEGILQRLQRAANLYQRGIYEATRVENIDKYTQKLVAVNNEMSRLTKGANVGSGWNGLQNSINQLTRELPAFTYSVQTGFMAISNNIPIFVDEINRLRQANEQLVASGQKGTPVWKQLLSGLFSWQTAMSIGITLLTVYGKEIGEWVAALFKGGKAIDEAKLKLTAMSTALSSTEYSKAIEDVTNLRLAIDGAKDSTVKKEDALKLYNSTIGKTAGELKTFNDLESWQISNEKKYLELMLRKAQAQAILKAAIEKTTEAEKKSLEGPDFGDYLKAGLSGMASGNFNIDAWAGIYNSTSSAKGIADANKGFQIYKDRIKDLQKFAKENGFDLYGLEDNKKDKKSKISDQEKLYDQILKSRDSAYEKLLSIDREYARKSMDSNQAEIQALKDKFAEVRKVLEEENKKIEDYNKKNAGKKGFKSVKTIDVGAVDPIEKRATDDTIYKQQTSALLKVYQDDYANYVKYEDLKKQYGAKVADEQLGQYKSTFEKISGEYAGLQAKKTMVGLTANEESYYKDLEKMVLSYGKKVNEDKRNEYLEALQLSQTYNGKLLDIQRKYDDLEKALGANASKEQLEQLKKAKQEEVNTVLSAEYEKKANLEKVFQSIQYLGKNAALDAIKKARNILDDLRKNGMGDQEYQRNSNELDNAEADVNSSKSWIASLDSFKKYRDTLKQYPNDVDKIAKAQTIMFSDLANDMQRAQKAVSTLATAFSDLGIGGEGLQETFGKVNDMLGGIGDIAQGLASKDPISVVAGSIKLLSNAISLFNTKDKKLQKQIEKYQDQLDSLGKSYDKLQGKLSNSDTNYYDNQSQVLKNLDEQEKAVRAMMKAEEDKKKTDKEKMKSYRDQLDDIDKRREEVEKSVRQMRLQTDINSLSQSITDALVSAFEAGEDGIKSMDKAFDKFIKNSIANSARLKFVQGIVDEMLTEVDKYMAVNDNSILGFDFAPWKSKFDNAGELVGNFLGKAYEGLGLEKDGTSTGGGLKDSLRNDIQGMTEQTAGRLEAEFGGMRLAQLQLLETTKSNHAQMFMIASDKLAQLVAIQQNTYRTANNTDRLANIENAIVSLNNKVSSSDAARRGAGL